MSTPSSGGRHLFPNIVAGLIGGLVASYVMEQFQRQVEQRLRRTGGAKGGGGQQHRKPLTEPATYVAAEVVTEKVTGRELPEEYKPTGGSLVHYAFGGATGAMYGAAAAQNESVTAWGGMPFGAAVWLAADEIGIPLSQLAGHPVEYSLGAHASVFTTHLVYGVTTEAVRKLLMAPWRNR